jgi:hypothetical protein
MPIYNDAASRVFGALHAVHEDVEATGLLEAAPALKYKATFGVAYARGFAHRNESRWARNDLRGRHGHQRPP